MRKLSVRFLKILHGGLPKLQGDRVEIGAIKQKSEKIFIAKNKKKIKSNFLTEEGQSAKKSKG